MADFSKETVSERQSRFNRSTQSHWLHFSSHRRRVMELILTGRELKPGGRFLALGAGNCNDLELATLLEAFSGVDLIDIDPKALAAATSRQGVEYRPTLKLHAPVDLTGIASIVSEWKRRKPTIDDVRRAVAASKAAGPLEVGGHFDVVLSSCVLSQLVGYATDSLGGDSHPNFRDLVQAIRVRHLQLMSDTLKEGGTGLLVCDLVSAQSVTELPGLPEHKLMGLIRKIAQDGKFFSGLYPDAVLVACQSTPGVTDAQILSPWLWRLGPRRSFLVYAIRFRRQSSKSAILSTGFPR